MMTNSACPLVEELRPLPSEEELFLRLASRPHCLFLDSAMKAPGVGRYSFLGADPFAYFEFAADEADSLGILAGTLAQYPGALVSGLPPFQGGAAGLLSYDVGRQLETLPRPSIDEFHVPALAVGLYDVVIALDHDQGRGWIVSQGFPELEPAARRHRAARRLSEVRFWLSEPPGASAPRGIRSLLPSPPIDWLRSSPSGTSTD